MLCPTAGVTDCHVASLLAMTVGDVLATADTCPSSACHCEPVRTLVWQSVLLAVVHGKSQHLRRIRNHPRIRPSSSLFARHFCRDADCHVASLLAMTVGEVPSRPTSLHPQTRACLQHVIVNNVLATADTWQVSACHCEQRSCNRRHLANFCMSLRTSAHTGVAIRVPAGKPSKFVLLRANS